MTANKLLRDISERMDFQIDNDRAYGVCNEVLCSIETQIKSVLVKVFTGPLDEIQEKRIRIFLLENKQDYSVNFDKTKIQSNSVQVVLEKVFIKADMAAAFAEDLAMYIHQLGITCNCDNCRSQAEFFNSSVKNKVCNQCFDGYHKRVKQVSTIKKKSENSDSGSYLTGFIGAFLGALLGLIPWILSHLLVAIPMPLLILGILLWTIKISSAALATKLALKGYWLLSGREGKGVIPTIIFVMILGAFTAVVMNYLMVAAILKEIDDFIGSSFFITISSMFIDVIKYDFPLSLISIGIGTVSYFLRPSKKKNYEM